ncbi:arginine deiminase family protein [Prolixibacter denitrificans]|uniref:arginine deiminase n=1 Tax=Prolixibacter denitrificans TaxID=1541063 RepID=A0A2P8CKJ4_9BACT|nr:arginine deiminase family protein [Prolixibacter denitrificans]PSK85453.1 arginine deiminase [Prolixibacter denitrificans]GET20073.1 arginine deiminase [Prolixibacter denitrificans]
MKKFNVNVSSEIGQLEGVILHTPGQEVENMTPQNAERALYSDILNLSVARQEYAQLKGVLEKVANTFEVRDLLTQTLQNSHAKERIINRICEREDAFCEISALYDLPEEELARQLIEGSILKRDNLTKFLSKERFALRPLHNFLFTRDTSMTVYDEVLIGKMASPVRDREALIMEAIFKDHPLFGVKTINPIVPIKNIPSSPLASIEGGDVEIARDDVILIGTGVRTTSQGIDYLIESIKEKKTSAKHIIVQELPHTPESFIHLDMTFTFLNKDEVMVYEPLILGNNKYQTIHITIDNGEVTSIKLHEDLLQALKEVGMDMKPIQCGGTKDDWTMEREQWHSGANFFSIAPGKVIGYERNNYTIEEMSKNGYDIIKAQDIIENKADIHASKKAVITIAGSELSRGGGGARCMTMPVGRKKVDW